MNGFDEHSEHELFHYVLTSAKIVNTTVFEGRPFTKETLIYSSPSMVLFSLALFISILAMMIYFRRRQNYVRKRRVSGSAFNETSVAELLMDEKLYATGIAHSYSTTNLSGKEREENKDDDASDIAVDSYIDTNIELVERQPKAVLQDDTKNITVTFGNFDEEEHDRYTMSPRREERRARSSSMKASQSEVRFAPVVVSQSIDVGLSQIATTPRVLEEPKKKKPIDLTGVTKSGMSRSLSLPSWKSFQDLQQPDETKLVSHHYKAKRRQRVHDAAEKARQENQDFLETNKRTDVELGNYLLSILNDAEQLYWADVPLYSYKHSRTLRNALIFIIMSMCLSLLFGVISAFIAPLEQALVISLMGVVACAIPLAAGLYYTISLRGLNIMYCMTSDRIIFAKRKGFLRNQFVHVSYAYDRIDINNIIHKEYLPEVSQRGRTYGNLFFAKDASSNRLEEWKLDPNSTHNRVGFRAILSVDEVEEILLLKIELAHRISKQQQPEPEAV